MSSVNWRLQQITHLTRLHDATSADTLSLLTAMRSHAVTSWQDKRSIDEMCVLSWAWPGVCGLCLICFFVICEGRVASFFVADWMHWFYRARPLFWKQPTWSGLIGFWASWLDKAGQDAAISATLLCRAAGVPHVACLKNVWEQGMLYRRVCDWCLFLVVAFVCLSVCVSFFGNPGLLHHGGFKRMLRN